MTDNVHISSSDDDGVIDIDTITTTRKEMESNSYVSSISSSLSTEDGETMSDNNSSESDSDVISSDSDDNRTKSKKVKLVPSILKTTNLQKKNLPSDFINASRRDKLPLVHTKNNSNNTKKTDVHWSNRQPIKKAHDYHKTRNVLLNNNNTQETKCKNGPCIKWTLLILRNPIMRNIFAFIILALNFLIYNEDPISYSEQQARVYGFGRIFNYYFRQYPPTTEPVWISLKVCSVILWTILGIILGKYFIHNALLRDLLDLKIFRKDMGSWPIICATIAFLVFIGSFIYNSILKNHFHLSNGEDNKYYILNDYIGIKEYQFGKIAVVLTWFCDYFNVFIINDSMLQDSFMNPKRSKKYGCNLSCLKKLQFHWTLYRKIIFFILTFFMFLITGFAMGFDWEYKWLTNNKGHFFWNQFERSTLCAFLILFDICMFMQDWDFPKFKNGGKNIKMVGCGDRIGCASGKFGCKIKFNGKWVNFGALILLLILDINLYVNQISYNPYAYSQISDTNEQIRNIYNHYPNNTILIIVNDTDTSNKNVQHLIHNDFYYNKTINDVTDTTIIYYTQHNINDGNDIYKLSKFKYNFNNSEREFIYCESFDLNGNNNQSSYNSETSMLLKAYYYNTKFLMLNTNDKLLNNEIGLINCYNVSESFNIEYLDSLSRKDDINIIALTCIPIITGLTFFFTIFTIIMSRCDRENKKITLGKIMINYGTLCKCCLFNIQKGRFKISCKKHAFCCCGGGGGGGESFISEKNENMRHNDNDSNIIDNINENQLKGKSYTDKNIDDLMIELDEMGNV